MGVPYPLFYLYWHSNPWPYHLGFDISGVFADNTPDFNQPFNYAAFHDFLIFRTSILILIKRRLLISLYLPL